MTAPSPLTEAATSGAISHVLAHLDALPAPARTLTAARLLAVLPAFLSTREAPIAGAPTDAPTPRPAPASPLPRVPAAPLEPGLVSRIRAALADGGGTVKDIARAVYARRDPSSPQCANVRATLTRIAKGAVPEAVNVDGWWSTPEQAAREEASANATAEHHVEEAAGLGGASS